MGKRSRPSGNFPGNLEAFQIFSALRELSGNFPDYLESFQYGPISMLPLSNEIFHCNKCFIAITYKNLCRKFIYPPIYRQLSQTRLTHFSPGKFLYQKVCYQESFCLFRPCQWGACFWPNCHWLVQRDDPHPYHVLGPLNGPLWHSWGPQKGPFGPRKALLGAPEGLGVPWGACFWPNCHWLVQRDDPHSYHVLKPLNGPLFCYCRINTSTK